ncbi:MAG TPA: methyltransferase domain-containing protein [Pseudonocardia sp.]|nr:methyltransferase domain-containing protein [Pseudonocardia sp.]
MDATTSHSGAERSFLPGLGRLALSPFYDVVHRLARVGGLHAEMIRLADPQPGERVLDVGCGTGNLLLALGRSRPGVDLAGIDPDFSALATAQRKAARAGVPVRWDRGFAEELPHPDGSVDQVLSSLMLHHLDPSAKDELLAEVRRVLCPGGVLVLADVDGDDAGHGHGPFGRRMAHSTRLRDNADIPGRIAAAGLRPDATITHRLPVGQVAITRATRA